MPTRLSAVVLALLVSGCATVVRGGQQHVAATTRPTGATIRSGTASCTTPCALLLPRDRSHSLEIEKPGYEKEQVPIYSSVDGLVFGNVFLLPLAVPGAVIDLLSGAAWELVPSSFNVNLRPLERTPDDRPESPFAPLPEEPRGSEPALPPPRDDGWKTIPDDGRAL